MPMGLVGGDQDMLECVEASKPVVLPVSALLSFSHSLFTFFLFSFYFLLFEAGKGVTRVLGTAWGGQESRDMPGCVDAFEPRLPVSGVAGFPFLLNPSL